MKKKLFLICYMFIITASLSAQKYEPVIVKAGMRVIDCFPFNERYRYPEFITGRIFVKGGVYSEAKLNFNFLSSEMEYLRKEDTLAIANKKDVRFIIVAQDTFYYDKGYYLEQINGGPFRVMLKQYIKVKETQKQDSYGTSSAGAATTSYGSLPSGGNFYKLTANTDMMLQRTLEYYLSDQSGGFVQYTKKNVIQLFPQKEDAIKAYLKSNKVKFDTRDDLIKLSEFLGSL
ncbi:MAG: hypothetical protein IPJ37_20480 [Bacteroidales bacterium]|nr:hypothetical protein [Bacteroidales bacterium]